MFFCYRPFLAGGSLVTTHTLEDEIARLLRARRSGDESASRTLFELLYEELRRMARKRLSHERVDHTLAPTSLAHEVFLRLGQDELSCRDRSEFLRLSATVMRRILVDSALRRSRRRRLATTKAMSLANGNEGEPVPVRLDEALEKLEACDPGLMRVVELRFLVGLGVEETARELGISTATVKRDWRTARAFLQHAIGEKETG